MTEGASRGRQLWNFVKEVVSNTRSSTTRIVVSTSLYFCLVLFVGALVLTVVEGSYEKRMYLQNVLGYSRREIAADPSLYKLAPDGVWSNFGTGLWLMLVTMTTIGYGDISPASPGAKTFLIFAIPIGLAVMGIVLSDVSKMMSYMIDQIVNRVTSDRNAGLERSLERARASFDSEKEQKKIARLEKAIADSLKFRDRLSGVIITVGVLLLLLVFSVFFMLLENPFISHSVKETADASWVSLFGPIPSPGTIEHVSYESFTSMYYEQTYPEVRWFFYDAVYFCMVSLATVGYGDYTPSTAGGRAMVFVFIALGLALVGIFIGRMSSNMTREGTLALERNKLKKEQVEMDIQELLDELRGEFPDAPVISRVATAIEELKSLKV